MSKSTVRVGIIGVGGMGELHARNYRKTGKAEIVAVSDVDASRAQQFAAQQGIPQAFGDYREMLAKGEVDAVDICTPPHVHKAIALDALEAGVYASVQKPMTTTLADAVELVRAAEAKGNRVMASHMFRFGPITRRAREIIKAGEIGRIKTARIKHTVPNTRPPKWTWNPEISGGMIVEFLIHDLDLLNWYFGLPEQVYCRYGPTYNGFHDCATFSLAFGENVVASLDGGYVGPPSYPRLTIEILGEDGALMFDGGTWAKEIFTLSLYKGADTTLWEDESKGQYEKVSYFVDCIASGRPVEESTARHSLEALQVAFAAMESATTKQAVNLEAFLFREGNKAKRSV